jgi:putative oxidoreductase
VRDLVSRAKDLAAWFRSTRDLPLTRDVALFLVRAGLAWIFIYHGAGTLFGAFHQAGIHGEIAYFQSQHLEPATFLTYVDGLTQFIGGIAIALGVFGRLAGFALAGDMIGAMATITFAQGIAGPNGLGYQLNLALIIPSLVIGFLGTGRFSLDELLRRALSRREAPRSHSEATLAASADPAAPEPWSAR